MLGNGKSVVVACVFILVLGACGDRNSDSPSDTNQISEACDLVANGSCQGAVLGMVSASGRDLTGIDFRKANLKGANFSGANLTQANFYGADVTGANFENAVLVRATFDTANMQGANFQKSRLTGASVKNAVIDGADFLSSFVTDANFSGSTGNMNLDKAFLCKTTMPNNKIEAATC